MKRVLVALVLLVACEADPVARHGTNNADVQLDTLFTRDGCTVYRFSDAGNLHYFARCEAASAEVIGTRRESCGKNCSHVVDENIRAEAQ